jgi:hypothetical protein
VISADFVETITNSCDAIVVLAVHFCLPGQQEGA